MHSVAALLVTSSHTLRESTVRLGKRKTFKKEKREFSGKSEFRWVSTITILTIFRQREQRRRKRRGVDTKM